MEWVTEDLTKSEVQSRLGREKTWCFAFKWFRYKALLAGPVSPSSLFWRFFATVRYNLSEQKLGGDHEHGGIAMSKEINRREFLKTSVVTSTVCVTAGTAFISPTLTFAAERTPISLLKPLVDGGRPFMQVLKDRKTSREFSPEKLPMQVLSNLLWAALGVNRPDSGKRTAPSANNRQEIDIYVVTADGLYLYDAKSHALMPLLAEDIREKTGGQASVKEAPVNLVYVADLAKMGTASQADREFYSAADTGFISQNVYLYCASEGLSTFVRAMVDRPTLSKAMNLRPDQKIVLAQSVGYPKR
jgi:nitroreductase